MTREGKILIYGITVVVGILTFAVLGMAVIADLPSQVVLISLGALVVCVAVALWVVNKLGNDA